MTFPYLQAPGTLGPMLGATAVLRAVEKQIATWADTYIAEVERQNNAPDTLMGFEAWQNRASNSELAPGEQPRYEVAVGETVNEPRRQGDGRLFATYAVDITITVDGQRYDEARQTTGLYLTAVRTLLAQQGIPAVAKQLLFQAERLSIDDEESARTVIVADVTFHAVDVCIANEHLGPVRVPVPATSPPPGLIPVTSLEFTVHKES